MLLDTFLVLAKRDEPEAIRWALSAPISEVEGLWSDLPELQKRRLLGGMFGALRRSFSGLKRDRPEAPKRGEQRDPRVPGECRTCAASILWSVNPNSSKLTPVDFMPTENGGMVLTYKKAENELHCEAYQAEKHAGRRRYTSHFATCRDAAKHRKPRGKKRGQEDGPPPPMTLEEAQQTIWGAAPTEALPTPRPDPIHRQDHLATEPTPLCGNIAARELIVSPEDFGSPEVAKKLEGAWCAGCLKALPVEGREPGEEG